MSIDFITEHDRQRLRGARNPRHARRLAREVLVERVALTLGRGYDQGLTGDALAEWAVSQGPSSPTRGGEGVWCSAWRAEVREQMGARSPLDELRAEAMRLVNRSGWGPVCKACKTTQDELIAWMRDGASNDGCVRGVRALMREQEAS